MPDATEAGTAFIRFRGDFSQLQTQLVSTLAPTKLSKLGKGAGAALAGGLVAAGVGKVLFDIGREFDDAYDKISQRTGKTGKQLDKLKDNFRDIAKVTPATFDEIAEGLSMVSQRLEQTGKPLNKLTRQFLELSRMTGTDLGSNVESVAKAFRDWEVPMKKQSGQLDKFFRVSQMTGIAVADLGTLLFRFGSPLRQLGIDLDFATAMFAGFEKAGVNMQTMMPGLRFGLKNLAGANEEVTATFKKWGVNLKDPEQGLQDIFQAIKKAPTDLQAARMGFEAFGQRAGPDMAEAIRQGRFEIDDLIRAVNKGDDTVLKAAKRTRDFDEAWQLLKNRFKLVVEPAATSLFNAISKGLFWIVNAPDWFKELAKALGIFAAAVAVGTAAVWLFNAASAVNPWVLLAAGIVVAAYLIYKNFDTIKSAMTDAWEWIKEHSKLIGLAFGPILGPFVFVVIQIIKNWQKIKNAFTNGIQWIKNAAKNVKNWLVEAWADLGDILSFPFRKGWNWIQNAMQDGIAWIRKALRKLGSIMGNLLAPIGSAFQWLGRLVQDALQWIINAVNNVKDALGDAKDISVGFLERTPAGKALGAITGEQTGGLVQVGGNSIGDRHLVQARVESGEVLGVVNREAAKQMMAWNDAYPRFQGGGIADVFNASVTSTAVAAQAYIKELKKAGVGSGTIRAMFKEAMRMNALHQPYLWGGGHAGFSANGPWDCSGAVSQVLHGAGVPISGPMVSGGFMSYGLPGLGQQGRTGIWANSGHVWMTIDGQGFSTSGENSGDGWGTVSYASRPGFVKRHPDLAAKMSGAGPNSRRGQPLDKGAQRGGLFGAIQGLQSGGLKAHKPWRDVFGSRFDKNETTTLAKFVNMARPALMGAIAMGESVGDPYARGDAGEYGLWQIMPSWGGGSRLLNPIYNALKAKHIVKEQGLDAWTVYNEGIYRSHLGGQVDSRKLGLLRGTKNGKEGKKGSKKPKLALDIPQKMRDRILELTRLSDEAEEYASRASSLEGLVGGRGEATWLTKALNELFRLRNALIRAQLWIQDQINRYAKVIRLAQKELKKKGVTAAAKKSLNANIAKWTKKQGELTSAGKDLGPALEDVQGKFAPGGLMDAIPPTGVLGGRIFDVQIALKGLGENAAPSAAGLSNDQIAELQYLSRLGVKFDPSKVAGFAGFFGTGGALGAGQWGIAGERGPEVVHGPAGVTPVAQTSVRVVLEDHRTTVVTPDEVVTIFHSEADKRERVRKDQFLSRSGSR